MPVGCRIVEPVRLGAHTVDQDGEDNLKTVHLTVANNAIVGTLLQLASLVRHADDLFCDISDECQKVIERTERINLKLKQLESIAGKLDAKQVSVPEGDLKQFSQISEYHEARHGYGAHLFLPTNRPQCILDQYALCAPNPVKVIRAADLYRRDGLSGSKYFKCWPVVLNEQTIRTPDLNLPRRREKVQRVRSFEKKYKQLRIRERPKTIHGAENFMLEDSKNELTEEKKHNEQCLTTTEPPVIVSIDTSGTNFERMQSLRLSGRRNQSKEEREKKKKRRRTVSGVPDHIMHEIEVFERKQKTNEGGTRHTPRSYSFDDLDAEDDNVVRDEGIVKYLDEIEGKMEERYEEEKALKIMKYFPCRRSRSLPRCVKLASVNRSVSADRKSQREQGLSTTYGSSSLSVASMASSASSRLSRATKRSSIISNKLRSLVNSGSTKDKAKPRPKSLDLDTFLKKGSEEKEEKERSRSTYSLERNKTSRANVPDSLLSREYSGKSSSTTIGPGSYYNFESSTLPRAQAKKYDFPWESLPKDWTTSVRLREISKRRAKEDRQSSSGNWSQSGTSSNRHSLDSDIKGDNLKFNSQYSLGKDSGRDSPTLEEENECITDGTSTAGYTADGTSTIAGSSDSVSVGNPKSDFTQVDTEAWLQSLAVRAAKREEVTSKSADTLTSLSRLTKQNILALDLMMSDGKPKLKTEEESSVYSIDQEGFYTSFHNDSGLKKSTNTLVDDEEYSGLKDSQSVCSVDSVIHVPDKNSKFAGLRKGDGQPKVLSKVNPPAPPIRSSSKKDIANGEDLTDFTKPPELLSIPSQDSSVSESDQEAVFTRVKTKTQISSTAFPSLVAFSTSEDESSPNNSYENSRKKSKKKVDDYIFNENETVEGFKNTSDLSFISHQSGSYVNSSTSDSFSPSESSLKHSKSALECTDQGYDSLTLPKGSQKKLKDKSEASYRSWPRSHKSPTPGILKTPEKTQDNSRPPKTLNFAPVVNLFNPGTKFSEQMPLPSPTNSSSSEGNYSCSMVHMNSFQPAVTPDSSYKLSVPLGPNSQNMKGKQKMDPKTGLPLKYQPVITVTPRSRSGDRNSSDRSGAYVKLTPDSNQNKTAIYDTTSVIKPSAQSTPHAGQSNADLPPNLYAVSPVFSQKASNRQGHNENSNSELNGYMDMQSLKSAGSSSSLASSDCLNFNDNTYMSMSSPCSSPNLSQMDFSISNTPSGSLDSLLDTRRTPTNGLENDTYQINTNLHRNGSNNQMDNRNNSRSATMGPVSTQSNTNVPASGQSGSRPSFNRIKTPDSNVSSKSRTNDSVSSVSSSNTTPGRRSLDSSHDLTRVTQISNLSTPGSAKTPVAIGTNSSSQSKQRNSRTDTRKEPSYRNTSRRSLPTDSTTYGKSLLADTRQKIEQTANLHQAVELNKHMMSSRSCPNGFNAINSSSETLNGGNNYPSRSANSQDQNRRSFPSYTSHDNSDNSRSDSYHVATGNKNRNSSYRAATSQSKSYPSLPASKHSGPVRVAMDMNPKLNFDEDVMCRADSYRIAVRNTNGIIPDVPNRNTSYRFAIDDAMPVGTNSKLEALSLNESRSPSGGRDARRMGITDVDQAKGITGKSQTVNSGKSHSLISGKSQSKDSKSTSSLQNGGQKSDRIRKVTQTDVDPIEIVSSIDNNRNDTRKANKNNQNRSSTYIQFDPIFEDDDFSGSTDTLHMSVTPSAKSSIQNLSHNSLNSSSGSRSKTNFINGGSHQSNRDSNFNVKTVKSSKSGKPIEIEDDWRFSQV